MTDFSTEAPRPWVPVLDMTVVHPFVDGTGKPARVTYTVREHLGDIVKQLPGGFMIQREAQDVGREGETYRIPGENITINASELVAIERVVRLEKRVRLTAEQMLTQPSVEDVEAKLRDYNREMREK
jgi:hypothetical protein